jgi:hypothetical protein
MDNRKGTGQLIGVADSGLDVYHNFFYDPLVPPPLNGTVNFAHRKLVTYIPFVDSGDYEGGHGTILYKQNNNFSQELLYVGTLLGIHWMTILPVTMEWPLVQK